MNSNILAYAIYLSATLYIIYWLGRLFHRNGRIFILQLYEGNAEATDTINNILLVAYYLFNIGYAFLMLRYWEKVTTTAALIASLSSNLGRLILILALTHYSNLFLIYRLSRKHHTFTS